MCATSMRQGLPHAVGRRGAAFAGCGLLWSHPGVGRVRAGPPETRGTMRLVWAFGGRASTNCRMYGSTESAVVHPRTGRLPDSLTRVPPSSAICHAGGIEALAECRSRTEDSTRTMPVAVFRHAWNSAPRRRDAPRPAGLQAARGVAWRSMAAHPGTVRAPETRRPAFRCLRSGRCSFARSTPRGSNRSAR
jgi:hypothetical protein